MSQRLIDRVRAKFPQYADVPDDRLTLAIGEKYPQYLEQDGNFARTFDAYRQMRLNDADTAARTSLAGHVGAAVESGRENFVGAAQAVDRELIAPLTGGTVDQWASAVPEAASLMLRQPVREAGKVFSAAGRLLAEDVRNVTRLTGLDPAGPVAKGLQDVGETAPVLAASMGLQRLGVNPALAFGAPPAVQTYGETGDVTATLKAGATGALIPAVAQVGKLGGAALNRALIERNLLSPAANATQKAVEVLGSQGAVQVFMEGLRLPEYAALDPEARREAIYRNLVANTAFLAMDLPTFKRSVPSETLLRMAPAERVAYGLRDAANNPELVDALQRTADELARQATLADAAQVEGEGPLFRREAPLGEVPGPRQNTQAAPDSANTGAQQETQAVDSLRSATSVEITRGSQTSPTPAGNTSAPSATARLAATRPIQEPWSDRWSVSLQVSNTDTGAFTNERVRESLPPELRGSVFEVRRFDGQAVPTDRSLSTPGRIQITFANKAAADAAIRWFSDPEARQQPVGRRIFPGPAADAPGRPLDPFPTDQGLGETMPAEGETAMDRMLRDRRQNKFREKAEAIRARRDAWINQTLDQAGERGSLEYVSTERPDRTLIVSPVPGQPGRWRTTQFDANVPIGHYEFDSREQAIRAVGGEHHTKKIAGPSYFGTGEYVLKRSKERYNIAADGRPLDPFPTDQGVGETVAPDAEWNVVGMGRKADAPKQAAGAAKAEPAEGVPVSAGTGSSTPTPEATPKPVTRKPRQFRPRETVGDILDDIEAAGGLISKSEARNRKLLSAEKNGPEYDDAPSGLAHPTHNFIYGNGRGGKGSNTPDRLLKSLAAQNPKYAGMTVPEMWAAIKQASAGRVGNARNAVRERTQAAEMAREEVRAQKDFNRAIQKQEGDAEVVVDELAVGQEMVIAGERFEVESIDPDTGDVVLKDGPRFGRRVVEAGKVIYVEQLQAANVSADFAADESGISELPPGFMDAPESVAEQRARMDQEAAQAKAKADREKLEELQAKPLTGSVGDIGQGDLLGGGDLFSAPAPRGTAGSPRQPQGQFGLPAIPAGTATAVPSKRMVVTMERLVPGFTTVANIERRLSAIVDVARGIADASPIRSNRLSRRFAGVYTTPSRVIRMWDRLNLPTTAHEVAHALADAIFGTAASRGLRGIPPSVGRELVRLGRNLYGNTRPNAGYAAEGWAELLADYLTTDDIARRAPQATQWLENTVLPAFPEVARAMREARAEIDVWRGMGARERMRAQTAPHDSKLARLRTELSRYVGREGLVEQFAPFEALSRRFRQVAGRDLAADEDPFLIASARRGQAGSILAYMADEGMIDPSGNRTGGRSLREALAPVTRGLRPDQVLARNQRAADFWSYLWARRAIERWGLDRNPGISLADAQYLRQTLETPDFQLAASRYYQWWDGVLDYLAASSPANRELVARIRAGSNDYVPLARMLDPNQTRPGEEARLSNALRRMRGSSLPVRMLDVQTLLTAESLIARAHRDQVMEAVFRLANQPGMGAMIEEVPRSQVQEVVNIERLRAQLEGMGVDTTGIPADTLLEYYTGADAPGGSDPIVARRVNGEVRWYYVRPDLYAALEGIQPARLPLVADLLLGVPARLFRMGTTGLRPAFSLFTNPVRDIQTFLMQSTAGVNPLRRVAQYFGALGDIVRSGMPGADATPYRDLFDRLGIMSGQPLGGDIGYARREARGLFHGRVFKRVTAPVETLRELLSFSEATPRIAELRLRAQEMGWAPGQPLTPAQAIQLTLAAKRVTTDFSASGSYARLWSQAVPFLNASIQGTRGFLRAMRERPVQATLYGVSMFTLPALWTWWHNKDEEWYQALPWRERYLYWNVPDENGQVYQIPRPPEWNNAFAVIPEALMDAAYRDNPDAVKAAFGHIFATTNPFDLPVLARIAWEQARNRVDFFDRPIVPRAQVDLRPGEQVGPYTSWLATSLGKAFPETISPRRVDHLLRGVGGGTASDTLSAIEQMAGLKAGALRSEPSETPVVGRALRRGGQFSAVNRQLADLYDLHYYWQARARNKELAPELAAYARYVDDQIQMVKFGQRVAEQTDDLKARQSLYRDLTRQAESMLTDAKRLKRLPAQQ